MRNEGDVFKVGELLAHKYLIKAGLGKKPKQRKKSKAGPKSPEDERVDASLSEIRKTRLEKLMK